MPPATNRGTVVSFGVHGRGVREQGMSFGRLVEDGAKPVRKTADGTGTVGSEAEAQSAQPRPDTSAAQPFETDGDRKETDAVTLEQALMWEPLMTSSKPTEEHLLDPSSAAEGATWPLGDSAAPQSRQAFGGRKAVEATDLRLAAANAGQLKRNVQPIELPTADPNGVRVPGPAEGHAASAVVATTEGQPQSEATGALANNARIKLTNTLPVVLAGRFFIGNFRTEPGVDDMPSLATPNAPMRSFSDGPTLISPGAGGSSEIPSQVFATAMPRHPDKETEAGEHDLLLEAEALRESGPGDLSNRANLRELDRGQAVSLFAARAEMVRSAAQQISAAIQARPESGGVDITLNPEELGRVSMILRSGEDGLFLSIATERPETMDLLRRHISQLTEEFLQLGYDTISFEFGTTTNGTGGNPGKADASPDREEDTAKTSFGGAMPLGFSPAGVDLRL
ncbi:flagellar hook-length control protein FliK [Ruegeria sediminis]|nr:flagellar hook-length control protein FliK [Ruegeria sediminis]